jgi:glycosyltransferase involved in cell wall biosynthesis
VGDAQTTNRQLRIALISYYLPSGSKIGVGYAVHELANALVRRGHDVTVVSDCPPVPDATYHHEHVAMQGGLRTFRFALAMRRYDWSGFDVIHAAGEDYWLWRRRVPAHVRTLYGSCFEEALHIRGLKERARMLLLGGTEVLASLVADRTAVISPATRRWTPWVKTVVPVGVDLRRFRPARPDERHAQPVVLFVGTWHGRKRGQLLADVFVRDVLPAVPDAELWMVSRDVPAGVHPSIKVLGEVSDDELAQRYRQAHVFCLPSSYEGFGIPYVEALASGTPVVATRNIGAVHVLADGEFGALVAEDELGAALATLLRDTPRREALAALSVTRAQAFDLDSVTATYEALYREVLGSA